MMLRIKNKEENISTVNSIFWILLFILIEYELLQILGESFELSSVLLDSNFFLFLLLDNSNNIDILGQALFGYYLICFLLAGILLLIALVGCIVLTLKFNNTEETQNVNRQLSRSDNFLSFFK